MVSIYLSYLLEKRPIVVKGSTSRSRDFIYVEDVVEAFCKAISTRNSKGKIYNIATGKKTTVQQILDGLIKAFGFQDYPIEIQDGTAGDQFGIAFDVSRAYMDLRWSATMPIDKGLQKTVEHERGNSSNG